ncbi:hypothetical protein SAMN05518856_111118 [Paenibacillus sp. OK003]|nr:hypothetical protein SAMN05518856_111118 [Paenibacillus sp. OK003]
MRSPELVWSRVFVYAHMSYAIFASKNDTMETCRTYGRGCTTYEEKSSGFIRTHGW